MKRERLFYLDFIRAVAVCLIVITHYNAIYLYLPTPAPEKAFITTFVSNIYIGDLGAALFFIISGAALMYVYKNECSLKEYYKKRFLSIYPMFWMTYTIDFLIRTYLDGGIDPAIPKWKIIFSVAGMDRYLEELVHPFLCVGEWFLGCIILMYLLFPLIRKMVLVNPVILSVIVMGLYILTLLVDDRFFPVGKNLFVHLPKFVLGMLFVCYIRKINIPMLLGAVCIVVVNGILKPVFIHDAVQVLYVGSAVFVILAFLAERIECSPVEYLSAVLAKYSYAVFLVHHVLIMRLVSKVDLENITKTDSYLLFFFCVLCIAFASKAVYVLHSGMMKSLKQMFKREELI